MKPLLLFFSGSQCSHLTRFLSAGSSLSNFCDQHISEPLHMQIAGRLMKNADESIFRGQNSHKEQFSNPYSKLYYYDYDYYPLTE